MAQQARPKVRGQREDLRDQLIRVSAVVSNKSPPGTADNPGSFSRTIPIAAPLSSMQTPTPEKGRPETPSSPGWQTLPVLWHSPPRDRCRAPPHRTGRREG